MLEKICDELCVDYKEFIIICLDGRINDALSKIDNMFDKSDENSIIDDLIDLEAILKGKN